jgi:ketosteroid isomerase-like protein
MQASQIAYARAVTLPDPDIHLVRDVFHDWNSTGDPPPDELIAPDFELHSPLAGARGAPYVGPAGVRDWIGDLNEAYGNFRFELEDLEQTAPGHVLALGRIEVEGRGPAAGLEEPAAWVIEVRDGKLARMELFHDQDEARAATVGPH